MPRVLAYDVTRLFVGPVFLTPRGIDRVKTSADKSLRGEAVQSQLGGDLEGADGTARDENTPAEVGEGLLEKLSLREARIDPSILRCPDPMQLDAQS